MFVKNHGESDANVNLFVDIYGANCMSCGGELIAITGSKEFVVIPANEESEITFEFEIPESKYFPIIDTYVYATALDFVPWFATVDHFVVGTQGFIDRIENMQTSKTILSGEINQGESVQIQHTTQQTTEKTRFALYYPGSDLDLHVYDSQGNHVGINYGNGDIENEICGAIYSGANVNPEWITIESSGGKTYSTKVVATQTNGNESYSLVSLELQELPTLLGLDPLNLTMSGWQGDIIKHRIILREYGSFNDLSSISITASNLTDGMGGILPSSSLTFDMPTTNVPAGSKMIVNLTVDIPTDTVEGRTYSGIITAEDDSGAVDTTQININVNPAECPLDMNDDNYVNAQDIVYLLTHGEWGSNQGHVWDLNDDGYVNAQDIVYALTHGQWGACP
ncbi:MAG: hypothetical protein KAU52_04885 [Methanosarcinales archaeon]|nr:hypothetical protein [Methanosarcinales archaeon]